MYLSAAAVVSELVLVGYLMSLPSVRQKLYLDNMRRQELWPNLMKKMVRELAVEAFEMKALHGRLLIAYNGALS
jgi:hypothetical protein